MVEKLHLLHQDKLTNSRHYSPLEITGPACIENKTWRSVNVKKQERKITRLCGTKKIIQSENYPFIAWTKCHLHFFFTHQNPNAQDFCTITYINNIDSLYFCTSWNDLENYCTMHSEHDHCILLHRCSSHGL